MPDMFCYQCEQTAGGTGCTKMGVCGKDPRQAALQDLLTEQVKHLGRLAKTAGDKGVRDDGLDGFLMDALFATVTNVNFDEVRLEALCRDAAGHCDRLAGKIGEADRPDVFELPADRDAMVALGQSVGVAARLEQLGPDVAGLQELLVYGLRGAAAYAHHARTLGQEDNAVYDYFHEALAFLLGDGAKDIDQLVPMCLRCGEVNLRVMELLDAGNTGTYGHPEPTEVRVTPVAGKCVLVSGHDLKDLEELLRQTAGKDVNVYTHGEMLPCLAYPGLKRYPHLVGNYGGAWQDQQKEFDAFPGAILMTTNCIQKPRPTYHERIFTSGPTAYEGVRHIADRDFAPVLEAALAAPGFAEDAPEQTITIGFARNAVLQAADAVVDAVKTGKIRHFFLIGGCDGAKPGRNYYTELAEQVPDDCVILTLACGKFRFNKLPFGDIGGIPRLLDIGQCNDAYSAVQIAVALAGAFECEVNDLPLSLVLSWFEQKAVVILLSLLHLGIRNIRIGPSLPAFIGPNVLDVLVKTFGLTPVSAPAEDLEAVLA